MNTNKNTYKKMIQKKRLFCLLALLLDHFNPTNGLTCRESFNIVLHFITVGPNIIFCAFFVALFVAFQHSSPQI